MNELILVNFSIQESYIGEFFDMLAEIDPDAQIIENVRFHHNATGWYRRISVKMNASAAAVIKLKYKDYSDSMYVSYISDELKDKYRK